MTKTYEAKPKKYDIPMIEDFLDQLMWELRAIKLENDKPGMKPNLEIVESLGSLQRRQKKCRLIPVSVITREADMTDAEYEQALSRFREIRLVFVNEAIRSLRCLGDLFEDAFTELKGKGVAARSYSARDILKADLRDAKEEE